MVVRSYHASTLELEVEARDAAWIVVNEVADRGWTARLDDGQSIPVLRGNGLFRALCLPAGSHRVEFRYSPLQLWRSGMMQRFAGNSPWSGS